MAKKKHNSKGKSSASKNSKPQPKKNTSKNTWFVIAGVVVAVFALVALLSGNSTSSEAAAPSGAEAGYIGRLLPVGYEAPSVADRTLYTTSIGMTQSAAIQDDSGFSVALSEVVDGKIVRFDYTRPDGTVLPMIAYVKPSGDLFTGVSYCPPCEGEGQTIAGDGTLTCDSCGTKRNLETNAGISGACRLYPLDEVPVTISGDRIEVDNSVLDSWTAQPLDRPVG